MNKKVLTVVLSAVFFFHPFFAQNAAVSAFLDGCKAYTSGDWTSAVFSLKKAAAFEENNVNYREACLEMAKLFWNENLEQLCVDASFSPAKQKLIEMKNRFDCENQCAILLIQSDGNTRQLWGGI